MEDFLPSFSNWSDAIWGAIISGILSYLWSKIQKLKIYRVPLWLSQTLIIYFLLTIYLTLYKTYEKKRGLVEVKSKSFAYEDVYMDGKEFVNCKFAHCKLIMKGEKIFGLIGNDFDGHCTWVFTDHMGVSLSIVGNLRRVPEIKGNIDKCIEYVTANPSTTKIYFGNPQDTLYISK